MSTEYVRAAASSVNAVTHEGPDDPGVALEQAISSLRDDLPEGMVLPLQDVLVAAASAIATELRGINIALQRIGFLLEEK